MKVAHVVNYVSEDGAFGGPIAVATAQMKELAQRGHDVVLIAGWDGAAEVSMEGVSASLHRSVNIIKRGFSGIVAPGTWLAVIRNARDQGILHVHFGRDIASIACSILHLSLGGKLICQTHGMVMPKRSVGVRVIDAIAIRPILRRAVAVLALTDEEEVGLTEVSRGAAVIRRLGNGLRNLRNDDVPRESEVLFLARLHPRKRVMAFAKAASLVVKTVPEIRFTVVGPDEGDLDQLQQFIDSQGLSNRLTYEGSLPPGQGAARIGRASVYVLPSYGEVFPMSVLEALSVGTPVVTTFDSGIAPLLNEMKAATITDGTPETLAAAIESLLLHPAKAKIMIEAGHTLVNTQFSIDAVVTELESMYGISSVTPTSALATTKAEA